MWTFLAIMFAANPLLAALVLGIPFPEVWGVAMPIISVAIMVNMVQHTACTCMPLVCEAVTAIVNGVKMRHCVLTRKGAKGESKRVIAGSEPPFPGLKCTWEASKVINPAQWYRNFRPFSWLYKKTLGKIWSNATKPKEITGKVTVRGRCHYEMAFPYVFLTPS